MIGFRFARHLAAGFLVTLPLLTGAYEPPPANNLYFAGELPDATLLSIETSGLKGEPQLVALSGGKLQDGLRIAEGQGRRLTLNATNAEGKLLYHGEVELDVNSEFVPQVSVQLKSLLDDEPVEVTLASHRLALEFSGVEREGALYTRIAGDVFDADGRRLELKPGEIHLDINDPRIRERLQPCPVSPGGAGLCTEFLPPKGAVEVELGACFRGQICTIEFVPPVVPIWRKISLGMGWHACALKLNGELYCWGQGEQGQLGYVAAKLCSFGGSAGATHGCSGFAQRVACTSGPCLFTDVSVGTQHTCAVDVNQDAWCWGGNYDGQLGLNFFDPDQTGSHEPRMVVGGLKFLSIHAGFNQTCGLTVSHQVYCWGDNRGAAIPHLTSEWVNDPRLVHTSEAFESMESAYNHACGRTTGGNLYCWGRNIAQVLGAGTFAASANCPSCPAAPLLMQGRITELASLPVSLMSTGAYGTCAHLPNGNTPCWGWTLPAYPNSSSLDRLARGFHHYCTISRGVMRCAGSSALGDGSDYHETPGVGPVMVSSPSRFREMDTGYHATCAIGSDENVYCWGSTSYAQLGLGLPAGYVTRPTPLIFPTTLKIPTKHFTWKF